MENKELNKSVLFRSKLFKHVDWIGQIHGSRTKIANILVKNFFYHKKNQREVEKFRWSHSSIERQTGDIE